MTVVDGNDVIIYDGDSVLATLSDEREVGEFNAFSWVSREDVRQLTIYSVIDSKAGIYMVNLGLLNPFTPALLNPDQWLYAISGVAVIDDKSGNSLPADLVASPCYFAEAATVFNSTYTRTGDFTVFFRAQSDSASGGARGTLNLGDFDMCYKGSAFLNDDKITVVAGATVHSTATIDTGFHSVAISKSGTTYEIYIDGVSDSTHTLTDVSIGVGTMFGTSWEGIFYDYKIYETQLSDANVLLVHNGTYTATEPALWIPAQEAGGGVLYDKSGNGKDATQGSLGAGGEAVAWGQTQDFNHDAIYLGYSLFGHATNLDVYVPYEADGTTLTITPQTGYTNTYDAVGCTAQGDLHNGALTSIKQSDGNEAILGDSDLYYEVDETTEKAVSFADYLAWVSYSDSRTWLKFHQPADNCRLSDSVTLDITDEGQYNNMVDWKGVDACSNGTVPFSP
jgi:hypothetical protein